MSFVPAWPHWVIASRRFRMRIWISAPVSSSSAWRTVTRQDRTLVATVRRRDSKKGPGSIYFLNLFLRNRFGVRVGEIEPGPFFTLRRAARFQRRQRQQLRELDALAV